MKLMLHSNGYGRTFLVDTPKSKVTRGIAPRLPPTSRTGPAFLYFGNPDFPSTRMQPSSEPCRSKSTIPTVSYARVCKSSTPAPAKSSTTKKADAAPPYSPPLRPWSERKAESNDVLDKILGRFDITMDCIVESFGGTSNTNEE
ncbi:hypothetical protein BSKO_00485 [Bryopsis sp. KO-2023]|nr:hypothetical protein BSKO_00485 [Bryopsis sp. KO-2023]